MNSRISFEADRRDRSSVPERNPWRTGRRMTAKVVAGGFGILGMFEVWMSLTLFFDPQQPMDGFAWGFGFLFLMFGMTQIGLAALVLFAYSRPAMRCLNGFISFTVYAMLIQPLSELFRERLAARDIEIEQWAFLASTIAGVGTYYLLNWIYDRDFKKFALSHRADETPVAVPQRVDRP